MPQACAAEPAEYQELQGCVAQEWAAAGLEAGSGALQKQPLSAVLFARLQGPAKSAKVCLDHPPGLAPDQQQQGRLRNVCLDHPPGLAPDQQQQERLRQVHRGERPDQQPAASDAAKREPRDATGCGHVPQPGLAEAMQSLQQQLADRDCMLLELQKQAAADNAALLAQLRAAEDATAAAVLDKDSRIQELLQQHEKERRAQQEQAARQLKQLQGSKHSLEAAVQRLTCEVKQAAAERAKLAGSLSEVTAAKDAAAAKLTDLKHQVQRTEEQLAAAGQATRRQLAAVMKFATSSAADQAKLQQQLVDLNKKAAAMAAEYASVSSSEAELRLMNTELRAAHAGEKAQLEQQAAAALVAQEQLQADNATVRGQLAAMQKLNRSLMVLMALQRLANFGRSRRDEAADGEAAPTSAALEPPPKHGARRRWLRVAAGGDLGCSKEVTMSCKAVLLILQPAADDRWLAAGGRCQEGA